MRLGVAGGTGLVGSKVVDLARQAGVDTVVIARSAGVDLSTGHGVDTALAGCDAVIDVTNKATVRARESQKFFGQVTANLVDAAHRAGVGHLVTLSIVGSDVVDFGYYLGKRVQEDRVRAGPVPWTVVRATQFFEFPEPLLASRFPVTAVPQMLCQPVAAGEVAQVLLDTAQLPASGSTVMVAGPRTEQMVDMARRIAHARHKRRWILPVRLPGAVGAAMAHGGLLPPDDRITTASTFTQFVDTLPQT